VLRLGSEPTVYAESLLEVCECHVESPLICVSGGTASDLKKRVGRIMRNEVGETLNRWRAGLVTAGIAALAIPVAVGLVDASPIPPQTAPAQIRPAAAQAPTRPEAPQTQPRPEAPPNIVGDYMGVLTPPTDKSMPPFYTTLHIRAAGGGTFSGTLESPEQGTIFPLTDVRVEGQSVSFTFSVGGGSVSWKGSIENNGARLAGALTQRGASFPLVFTRETGQAQIPSTPTRPETPQAQPRPEAAPNAVRPADVPRWEAVSVRPCAPAGGLGEGRGGGPRSGGPGGGGGPVRFSADRMTLNCLTVRSLIRSAYHVYLDAPRPGRTPLDDVLIRGVGAGRRDPTDRTDGGPDWLDTDGYTIEAKAEGVADRALMQGPMLQAILEDRFKLKVHRETRETAVDALVIASGGSKLKPFVEGSCVRHPERYHSPDPPSPFALSPQRQPRYCRIEGGGLNFNRDPKPVNIVYHAEGVTIDEFVKLFLNGSRSRFVIDKSGLTGRFDIHLEAEISAETRQRLGVSDDVLGPSTAPPLPEALQRQLGLKLEPSKGPVGLLVIDHVERPSPN
jgi:uncharacterized protein (TIGR03435 family)